MPEAGSTSARSAEIPIPAVGHHVELRIILDEAHRTAHFQHVAGVNFLEAIRVHSQRFGVAVVGRANRKSKLIFVVEDPAHQAFGILSQESQFASGYLQLVEIVPGFVTVIEADVEEVRVAFGPVVYESADTFEVRKVPGFWRFRASRGRGRRLTAQIL